MGINKLCKRCKRKCKQHNGCEIIYCPMFERIREKSNTTRKVADVREVMLKGK